MIKHLTPTGSGLAVLTVLVLAGSLAACTPSGDGTPAGSSGSTSKRVVVPPVTLASTLNVGSANLPEGPFIARTGGTTVTGYDDVARGFTPTGAQKWIFTLPKTVRHGYGLDVAVNGAVTVLTWRDKSGDTVARVMDTASGRLRWTYRTSLFIDASPRTVFATACAPDDDLNCTLRALEPATGAVRWTRKVAGRPYPRTASLEVKAASAVVVDVDYGRLGSDTLRTHFTESFDEATGTPRRLAIPSTTSYVAGSGGVAVFTTTDDRPKNGCTSQVIAADLRSGTRIWARSFPATLRNSGTPLACSDLRAAAPDADTVAVHPSTGTPVVLDIRSGRVVAMPGTDIADVAARSGTISYVQSGSPDSSSTTGARTVFAVRDNGTVAWSVTQDGSYLDAVGLIGNLVAVSGGPFDRTSSIVRAATGTLVQRVPGRIPSYGDDWFATWDGNVVRIYDVRN